MKHQLLGLFLLLFVFSPIILAQITPNQEINSQPKERTIIISPDQKTIDFGDAQGSLSISSNNLDISSQFSYTISTSKLDGKTSISHSVIPNVLIAGNWNPSLFKFGVDTRLISRDQFVVFHTLNSGLHPDENGNLFNSPFFGQTIKWNFGDTKSITFDQNTVFDSTHLVFKGFIRDFAPEIRAGFVPSQIKIANNIVSLVFTPPSGIRTTSMKIGDFFIDTNFSDGTFFQTQVAADANLTLDFSTATAYQLFGDYNSGIIDAGGSATWNDFNWTETTPFFRELPDNNKVDADVNMQLTTTLLHLNGNANDTTVGYQGTLLGNTNCGVNGLLDRGCYFDGTNDAIQLPSMAATSNVNTFTISLWVARAKQVGTGLRGSVFHASETGAADEVVRLELTDGNVVRFDDDFAGLALPGGACILQDVNKFYHIAVTRSDSALNYYFNGILCQIDSTLTANTGTMGAQIFIGGRTDANTSNFNGYIDELAVFPRVLTTAEIVNLAHRGLMDANFQVRSCDDAVCAGETFVGAGGTSATYYTDGNVNWDLNAVSANRYFQYRAFLTTLDGNRINVNTPKISNVSVRYTLAGGGAANNVPVALINSPNGAQNISQYRFGVDQNTLIDFNASDADNPSNLQADIFISTTQGGFQTQIVDNLDLNFLASFPTADANCSGTPFGQSRRCFYDINTATYQDLNFFIDINVFDANNSGGTDSSNLPFRIDQNKDRTSWDGNNNKWQNFDANVHLTCTDIGGSGCQTTRYRTDTDSSGTVSMGAFQTYSASAGIVFSSDGNFAIDFNSMDRAQNIGDLNRFYVLIDKNAPHAGFKRPVGNETSGTVNNPTFAIQVIDSNSAGKSCRAHVFQNGANVSPYNRFVDINASGWCSFIPLTLSSGDTAFTHWDILTDNADNNATIDVNTGIWTFLTPAGNATPILDINRIDGFSDRVVFPVFSYAVDGNLTIDLNVFDFDNNRMTLDLNYSTSQTQGTGSVIINDLNLTSANCPDLNFSKPQGVSCTFDWNISPLLVADSNYFILGVLSDSQLEDFNATERSFAVDNIPPTAVRMPDMYFGIDITNTRTFRNSIFKIPIWTDQNISTPMLCLGAPFVCRTTWPSGGSDGNTTLFEGGNIDLNAATGHIRISFDDTNYQNTAHAWQALQTFVAGLVTGSGGDTVDIGNTLARGIVFGSGGDAEIRTNAPNLTLRSTAGGTKNLAFTGFTRFLPNTDDAIDIGVDASSRFKNAYFSRTVDANNYSVRGGIAGLDKNLTIMKTAVTTCDQNFIGGILVATTC